MQELNYFVNLKHETEDALDQAVENQKRDREQLYITEDLYTRDQLEEHIICLDETINDLENRLIDVKATINNWVVEEY